LFYYKIFYVCIVLMDEHTDTKEFLDNIPEPTYSIKPNIQYIKKDSNNNKGAGVYPKKMLKKHLDSYYSKNFIKNYFTSL